MLIKLIKLISVAVLNLFAKEKHQELIEENNKKSSTEKQENKNLQEQPESQVNKLK